MKGPHCSGDAGRKVKKSSQGLVFTWGSGGEAAAVLEVPAPSGVCSARLQAGPRAAFCCSGMAGRKELWH